MQRYTIHDFNRDFPDDDACLTLVRDLLYPDGIQCRKCEEVRVHHRLTNRKAYSCDHCGTHVYPLAGTIFEKSRTPLKSWFYAMYLMASTRCGISAKQIERELGVTYKTAWRMFKQIRTLRDEDDAPFDGAVEIDQTLIGGKRRGKGRGYRKDRAAVLGMVQRNGKVAATIVDNARARTLMPHIRRHVLPSAIVYTDEGREFARLRKRGYANQRRINHSAEVYVRGDVHTNTIEGFWSLLKRGISGVYHSVSHKYLQSYLDEYAFRYNHRDDAQAMFQTVGRRVRQVRAGRYGTYSPVGR